MEIITLLCLPWFSCFPLFCVCFLWSNLMTYFASLTTSNFILKHLGNWNKILVHIQLKKTALLVKLVLLIFYHEVLSINWHCYTVILKRKLNFMKMILMSCKFWMYLWSPYIFLNIYFWSLLLFIEREKISKDKRKLL